MHILQTYVGKNLQLNKKTERFSNDKAKLNYICCTISEQNMTMSSKYFELLECWSNTRMCNVVINRNF